MSIVYFVIGASGGFLLSIFAVIYLQKRRNATPHLYALAVSIGMLLMWGGAFFLPLLLGNTKPISGSLMLFGLVNAALFGFFAYVAVRVIMTFRNRGK
jgi:hypothetical protein